LKKLLRLHGSYWTCLDPLLDVWNVADSLDKIGDLGKAAEGALVRKVADVHEGVDVSPREVVANEKLTSSTLKLLFKLTKSSRYCDFLVFLHTFLIFSKIELDTSITLIFLYKKVIFWLQPQNFLENPKLSLKNYLILPIFTSLKLS